MKFLRVFLIALLLSWCHPINLFAEKSLEIVKVLDGETIELNDGRHIRLLGVVTNNVGPLLRIRFDASEDQLRKMKLDKLPIESKNFMQKNVLGKRIRLSFDPADPRSGRPDEEGNILAYVWYSIQIQDNREENEEEVKIFGFFTEDKMLNGELIKLGYGCVETKNPFSQQEIFLRYEQQAAQAKRGLWQTEGRLYGDMLERARGSGASSIAGFVTQEAREMSLVAARNNYSELIKENPGDHRAFYERSWLGASPFLDTVSEDNIKDIEEVIKLDPYNPKSFMHKHFLLRLLGKDEAAISAYQEAILRASKLGMRTTVSDIVQEEAKKTEHSSSLLQDAWRASYNEDHFLIFMARFKQEAGNQSEEAAAVFQQAMASERFKGYYQKHKELLEKSTPRQLIYQTQWGIRGIEEPEDVLKSMETVN